MPTMQNDTEQLRRAKDYARKALAIQGVNRPSDDLVERIAAKAFLAIPVPRSYEQIVAEDRAANDEE